MREITAQWGSEPKPFWVCGNLSTNFHGLQSALSLRCQSDWHLPPTLPYFPMVIYQLEWKSLSCLFFPFFKESLSYSNWLLKEKSLYSYGMGISVRRWLSLIPNLARGVLKWVNWDQICLRTHHWPCRGRTEAHISQHLLPDCPKADTSWRERSRTNTNMCTMSCQPREAAPAMGLVFAGGVFLVNTPPGWALHPLGAWISQLPLTPLLSVPRCFSSQHLSHGSLFRQGGTGTGLCQENKLKNTSPGGDL